MTTLTVRTVRCRSRRADRPRVLAALDRLDPDAGLPRSAFLVVRQLQGSLAGEPAQVDGVDLRTVAADAHRAVVGPAPFDS
jgi:DNA-directed RNA polymerase specialized sigma24 family protein